MRKASVRGAAPAARDAALAQGAGRASLYSVEEALVGHCILAPITEGSKMEFEKKPLLV